MSPPLLVREWLPRDYDFVLDSWMRSLHGSWYAGPIPDHLFSPTYQRVLEAVVGTQGYACKCGFVAESLPKFERDHPPVRYAEEHLPVQFITPARAGVKVLVACDPLDDPKHEIFGWACVETDLDFPVLHYAYVRGGPDGFRRMGVARYLLNEAGIHFDSRFHYTFKTRTGDCWLKAAGYRNARFDPRYVTKKKRDPSVEYRQEKGRRDRRRHLPT